MGVTGPVLGHRKDGLPDLNGNSGRVAVAAQADDTFSEQVEVLGPVELRIIALAHCLVDAHRALNQVDVARTQLAVSPSVRAVTADGFVSTGLDG